VRTQFAEGLPRVQGDRIQLQQVMLNLIVNAIQAMSGIWEGARELKISIDAVPSEGGMRVGVRDTGPGLSPRTCRVCLNPSTRRSPTAMGNGPLESAARLSKPMVDGCGQPGAAAGGSLSVYDPCRLSRIRDRCRSLAHLRHANCIEQCPLSG